MSKILRGLTALIGGLVLLGACGGLWFYFQIRASLPQLAGSAPLPGLGATVTIERDALGIPTVRGASYPDVVRALGYLHAQDRFFQMDMLRRRAAGELSEVIGAATIAVDENARVHGFRAVARQSFALDTPAHRRLVEAYTAGVNAGLTALRQKPFEYLALRAAPQPWLPEDSYLMGFAMAFDLQESRGDYERSLTTLRDQLGPEALAFFAPLFTPDDAALDATTGPLAPLPSAKRIDLRLRPALTARRQNSPAAFLSPGSNAFALSGAHTTTGVAMLASDMHLNLSVPNTWYRAALVWPGHQVSGLTLPGAPCVIAGSNGHVAWGFTNANADTSDVIIVEPNTLDRSLYKSGDGNLAFTRRTEIIRVRGAKPVEFAVTSTLWGPVIGTGVKTRPLAFRWVMHEPAAVNFGLCDMASATTSDDAIAIAHQTGIPAQNIVIADRRGAIAWTIAGRLPKRVGYEGRLAVPWSYGDRYWDGLVPPDEVPVIRSPAHGRLWTANNRLVGGEAGALLGDGGYVSPPRAAQIRDDLTALEKATPAALLAVQLDDRALFLARWQKLLLQVLTPEAVAQKKSRARLRRLVEHWEGRAAIDSVSYRLVREFRARVAELTLDPIFASCMEANADFNWHRFNYEESLWVMLHEKPAHLLDLKFTTWDELLIAAADAMVSNLDESGVALDQATWGRRNTARLQHPFARLLPSWLTGWLNLPADPLAGDDHMPRVQTPTFGASERFVVSPGHEAEGIMHLPGGQSGNPLSPFYRAGHAAWVKGEPTPFLPGPVQHTLTLVP
ncbi:MAG: penicillin acylase family protein [Opitutaceae bacterium]|nr:penicillin acylase family protein [Opitutaceae bacterium]